MTIKANNILWIFIQLLVLVLASAAFLTIPINDQVQHWNEAVALDNQSTVRLPDDWRTQNYGQTTRSYSIEWQPNSPAMGHWGMLLRSVNQNITVYFNDEHLESFDVIARHPEHRHWFRPLLFPIAAKDINTKVNIITLHLSDPNGSGYLSAPIFGSYEQLAKLTAQENLRRQTLLQAITIAMFVVAGIMLVLWNKRRQDMLYGLYGAGMLCWAISNLNFIVVQPLLPLRYWDALLFIALGGFILFATIFIQRFLNLEQKIFEKMVWVFFAIGAFLLLILPEPYFLIFNNWIWHPSILTVGLFLYLLMFYFALKRHSAQLHCLAISGAIMVLYGCHDTLIKLGIIPWGNGYLLPYSAAPSLVIFSILLVSRFTNTLDELEALSRDLHQRVKEATNEVETNLLRVRTLERQQLISAERERVARDIHDGVGGQLVALLSRIKNGKFTAQTAESGLKQAMDDLRLVIGSLDLPEGDLGTALATWRHRLERGLDGCNIQLLWQPSEVKRLPSFGPSDILQVLRLLDEAATNAIKHAQASSITIKFSEENNFFMIYFKDNGRGGARFTTAGYGLSNMQRRAKTLKADFQIESNSKGTTIVLAIPWNTK